MSKSASIKIELTNFQEMRELLKGLPASVEARVMADAVQVATRPMVQAMQAGAPRDTGALSKSITSVVRRYPKQGKVVALIGPDNSYYGPKGKRKKKGESRRGANRPRNYVHLVEFGHRLSKGGSLRPSYNLEKVTITDKNGRRSKRMKRGSIREDAKGTAYAFVLPRPFMRTAAAASQSAVAGELERGVMVGMEREVNRIASKLKRIRKGT